MEMLNVECRTFEKALNCSLKTWPKDIEDACCKGDPSGKTSRQYYFSRWMKCCQVLEDNGHARPDNPDWENGSYQAYVMGVAVFAILICLFVSGAKSIRRRRLLMRARLNQQVSQESPDSLPHLDTQISLGPPTYGELEASGLTKDYRMGLFDPPAYPGVTDSLEEYVAPPGDLENENCVEEDKEEILPKTERSSQETEISDTTGQGKGELDDCTDDAPAGFSESSRRDAHQQLR